MGEGVIAKSGVNVRACEWLAYWGVVVGVEINFSDLGVFMGFLGVIVSYLQRAHIRE
jgi:hypothetical protein